MNNVKFSAIQNGHLDNINTYGLISGMWMMAFALGSFLGPTFSGILYENFGFRNSTYFVVVLQMLVATMYLGCYLRQKTAEE
jgi:MFS family permease